MKIALFTCCAIFVIINILARFKRAKSGERKEPINGIFPDFYPQIVVVEL